MTTAIKCLLAFMFVSGAVVAQEHSENSASYSYEIQLENVNSQSSDAIIKDVQTFAKDLFEAHPKFAAGIFSVETDFQVEEDRIRQYLELFGYTVSSVRIVHEGKVLTAKTIEQ